MGNALIRFLSPLSPRERWLLAGLFGVIAPLAVVFGVLMPMSQARQNAADQLAAARATTFWVVDRVGEARALGLTTTAEVLPPPAPIGTAGLEQSLRDAGLRDAVQELAQSDAGVLTLRFEDVTFTRLATWLSDTDPTWGYDLAEFRIEAAETSALVDATLILIPPAAE